MLKPGDLAPPFSARPVFGLPVSTGGRPLVVLFLRSLSGGLARAAIAEAERALPRIEANGGAMVALSRCDLELARDLVPRNHVLFPVVVEPDGDRFDAWGVGRDKGLGRSLLALFRPASLRTVGNALALGRGRPDGGYDQLPAEFVIGADGRVRYAHYGTSVFDQPDIEALCAALP